MAAKTKGVVPLAEIPTTASYLFMATCLSANLPSSVRSSTFSWDLFVAFCPPAIILWTSSGGVPKVGTHSHASITPIRPLLPAPT